jgi:hypothetical protein
VIALASEQACQGVLASTLTNVCFGLFASSKRVDNIARARQLLTVPKSQNENTATDAADRNEPQTPSHLCPCCGGRMIVIETFERGCSPRTRPVRVIRNYGDRITVHLIRITVTVHLIRPEQEDEVN